MIHEILGNKATRLYIILGAFFTASAIVAEMIGVKLFQLETALGLEKADLRCSVNITSRSCSAWACCLGPSSSS